MSDSLWIKNIKTPIAVIGLGKSGTSVLRFLEINGFKKSDILTYDDKDSSADFSNPEMLVEKKPQTLVVSPGVPLKTSWIQKLISDGAFLTSEISLASSVLTTEKTIGVTGSVGKSTVTSILGEGAAVVDSNCFVGGNLGIPFCDYAIKVLTTKKRAHWVILELSSYQLENCSPLKLDYSAITFLSPNHLERYESLEQYYQTKLKITEMTKDVCVVNGASIDAVKYVSSAKCPVVFASAKSFTDKNILSSVVLIGEHNKDNFSVAAEIANLCEWPHSAIKAMMLYRGLQHRLEFVAEIKGVRYINDSKATAMDSVLVAVQSCLEKIAPNRKLFLLLGGKDKNLPWNQLSTLSKENSIHCVFFGACGRLAQKQSGLLGPYFEKLGTAIEFCQLNASSGDTVLLSPGGTSLDEFKKFEERGDYFKRIVLSSAEA